MFSQFISLYVYIIYQTSLLDQFIRPVYRASLSCQFIRPVYHVSLSDHFIIPLNQTSLSGQFIRPTLCVFIIFISHPFFIKIRQLYQSNDISLQLYLCITLKNRYILNQQHYPFSILGVQHQMSNPFYLFNISSVLFFWFIISYLFLYIIIFFFFDVGGFFMISAVDKSDTMC